jgi:hypothetical protein
MIGRGGGHGGGHGHGGGFFYTDPYGGYYTPVYEEDPTPFRGHVVGDGLSVGTGALIVLGLMAYLVLEADKRVPK